MNSPQEYFGALRLEEGSAGLLVVVLIVECCLYLVSSPRGPNKWSWLSIPGDVITYDGGTGGEMRMKWVMKMEKKENAEWVYGSVGL